MSRRGILFDLDGTLVDTAPDLVAVLNQLLVDAGRPPMPYAIARNEVSNGAVGLLRLGFGLGSDAPVPADLRQAFLDLYARNGHSNSRLFIALEEVIKVAGDIEASWGIVTNKPGDLTEGVLEQLGIRHRIEALVCGDTLPQRKPHPAPLLHAAAQLGTSPEACIYIGDARRDIEAGRAAGMQTIATTWGYIRPGERVSDWRADAEVDHPRRIGRMLMTMTDMRL